MSGIIPFIVIDRAERPAEDWSFFGFIRSPAFSTAMASRT
jgi:hypothetical protein